MCYNNHMKKAVKELCDFRKKYGRSCRDCIYYRTELCNQADDNKPQDKNRKEEIKNGN